MTERAYGYYNDAKDAIGNMYNRGMAAMRGAGSSIADAASNMYGRFNGLPTAGKVGVGLGAGALAAGGIYGAKKLYDAYQNRKNQEAMMAAEADPSMMGYPPMDPATGMPVNMSRPYYDYGYQYPYYW